MSNNLSDYERFKRSFEASKEKEAQGNTGNEADVKNASNSETEPEVEPGTQVQANAQPDTQVQTTSEVEPRVQVQANVQPEPTAPELQVQSTAKKKKADDDDDKDKDEKSKDEEEDEEDHKEDDPDGDDEKDKKESKKANYDPKQILMARMNFDSIPESDHCWLIMHKADPIAKISLHRQENPEQLKQSFFTDEYGESIDQTMSEVGVQETLHMLNAEMLNFEGTSDAPVQMDVSKMRQQVVADFIATSNLTIEALRKNIIANPLKGAIYDILDANKAFDGDLAKIASIADDIFEAAGAEFTSGLVSTTVEYMEQGPEGRQATAKIIQSSSNLQPPFASVAKTAQATAMAANSVNLESYTGNDADVNSETQQRQTIRQALSGSGQ